MILTDAFDAMATLIPDATKTKAPAAPIPTVKPEIQAASDVGTRALWLVFIIMLVATVVFTAMSWSVPVTKRLYHTVTTLIVMIAAISYFGMATGHGVALHKVEYTVHEQNKGSYPVTLYRQVYWQRYIDWSLTTPLLLLDLALLAGLNGFTILTVISADLVMILTGLFAAFGGEETPQKWGWYTIACVAYVVIVWQMATSGRQKASSKGNKVSSFYVSIAAFTLVLWTAYPVIWGVADGSRNLTVDQEIISYAILDVLAKPVFGLWLLFTHSRLPESNVELGGFWAHGLGTDGQIRIGDDEDGA